MDNLYADNGDRMIGDIDFLVKEADYLKTAEIVLSLGYKNQFKTYDDFKTMKHYPRLFRENSPADIEIHRIPVKKRFTKQFYPELILKNKTSIIDKKNWFVSSDTHKLIHTFIHSQLSNYGFLFKALSLRDLYDTHLLLKRVDKHAVLTQIEEKRKAKIFFEYTEFLFSRSQEINNIDNKKTKSFVLSHQKLLNHPGAHKRYIRFFKLYNLVFESYIGRILKALYQKESFQHIYYRLKDPAWYKMHIGQIKKLFS